MEGALDFQYNEGKLKRKKKKYGRKYIQCLCVRVKKKTPKKAQRMWGPIGK